MDDKRIAALTFDAAPSRGLPEIEIDLAGHRLPRERHSRYSSSSNERAVVAHPLASGGARQPRLLSPAAPAPPPRKGGKRVAHDRLRSDSPCMSERRVGPK